jgi:hypothetical protein
MAACNILDRAMDMIIWITCSVKSFWLMGSDTSELNGLQDIEELRVKFFGVEVSIVGLMCLDDHDEIVAVVAFEELFTLSVSLVVNSSWCQYHPDRRRGIYSATND